MGVASEAETAVEVVVDALDVAPLLPRLLLGPGFFAVRGFFAAFGFFSAWARLFVAGFRLISEDFRETLVVGTDAVAWVTAREEVETAEEGGAVEGTEKTEKAADEDGKLFNLDAVPQVDLVSEDCGVK